MPQPGDRFQNIWVLSEWRKSWHQTLFRIHYKSMYCANMEAGLFPVKWSLVTSDKARPGKKPAAASHSHRDVPQNSTAGKPALPWRAVKQRTHRGTPN